MSKKGIITVSVVLALIIVLLISFSVTQLASAKSYKSKLTSSYNRAFYELNDNIERISVALSKAAVAGDTYQLMRLSAEISESAAFAISDIGQLPLDEQELTNINTFLNQSGDYIISVAEAHSDGSVMTNEESNSFIKLSEFAKRLKDALSDIRDRVASGEVTFERISREELSTLGDSLRSIETDKFADYEKMSYDGLFSEHMNTLSSVMLAGYPQVDGDEALKLAMNYLYNNVVLTLRGESNGQIPAYVFSGDSETAHYSVEVSKNGGRCISITAGRSIGDPKVGISEAISRAKNYLNSIGYTDMKESYYETIGATLLINFAWEKDGVTVYPDLIKVVIALDTGEVVGFSANGYLMNHRERSFDKIKLTGDEALETVSKGVTATVTSLAVIPTEYGDERTCYEIRATQGDKIFIIYVNAQSGRQEEIFLFTEDEQSRLVI